ncbi:hypothetical protein BGP80_23375 [Pseudomonas putida]|uniref:AbrB/MazE/SpoVT family DNA-binding domain-containing protein n=1 Tax=Pseudomonas putida TaxID=303 RepID=A0A2S3WJE2_PSEPU|nr:AbrB family transcriptional regulator [Pseudomonas putida]POF90728.1 hypothetical protein BGP80_23375 [Pseudomonas putida]
MNESVRTTLKCQEPGDGTGDVITDLPDDILERMGLKIGDSLSIQCSGQLIPDTTLSFFSA